MYRQKFVLTVKLIDMANRIDERRLQIYGECKKM